MKTMKKLLAMLSFVLFANQAGADDFKNGDRFICINHQEITLLDDNIWPAAPYMLEDIELEINDGVLFARTNVFGTGTFPGEAKILNYQRMTDYLLAYGYGSTYGLSKNDGVVRFGYAIMKGGMVTSGTATPHLWQRSYIISG